MSFAEGLLSGIAGGLVGAGQAAADITKRDSDNAAKLEYEQSAEEMRTKVLLARQKALDEYKRGVDTQDLTTIQGKANAQLDSNAMEGLGEIGQGANLTEEDAQTLRDNPEAVAAYRNAGAKGLLNYDRRDELKAKMDVASGMRPDMAKDFRSDLKDLNAEEMLALKERDTASKEKRDAAIADKAARSGSGGSDSNGGVEGWQYRQWKQENPSGSYSKFKEWMSDSKYNKENAVMEVATKLLSGNRYPTDEDVQAAMNTADKLVNKAPSSNANGAQKGGKTDALPQGARQIGTSGGKPVYQTPDGKRFIKE